MSWDQEPPKAQELKPLVASQGNESWDALPPDTEDGVLMKRIKDVRDIGLGGVQGATMGGADELEAGIKMIPDLIKDYDKYKNPETVDPAKYFEAQDQQTQGLIKENPNRNKNPELEKLFREYQGIAEKKYTEANDRSPWLYGAGQIAGGVASAPIAAEAGLISSFGKLGIKEILKNQGKAGLAKELAKRAGMDAVASVPAGAIYGSLSSDHDIIGASPEEQLANVKDTGSSAAVSGLLTGGVSLLSHLPAMFGSGKAKPKTPAQRQRGLAYEQGLEGIDLKDEATKNDLLRNPGRFADEMIETLDKPDRYFGEQVGKSLDDATEAGTKINISDDLNLAAQKLESAFQKNPAIDVEPRIQKIMMKLLSKNESLTPEEARSLKQELEKIKGVLRPGTSSLDANTANIVGSLQSGVDKALKEAVPEYKTAAKNFAQNRNMTTEQIISGSKPVDVTGVKVGSIKNPDLKLRDTIERMIRTATTEGISSPEQKAAWSTLQQSLRDLEKQSPLSFKKMGDTAEGLIGKIQKKADEAAVVQRINQIDPHTSLPTSKAGLVGTLGGTAQSQILNIYNKVGLMAGGKSQSALLNTMGSIGKGIGQVASIPQKALFDLPLEGVGEIANVMAQSGDPAAARYGQSLAKAIANKDTVAKNAAIFAALQNPSVRKMLNVDTTEENQ